MVNSEADVSDAPNIADWLAACAAVTGLGLVLAQIRHSSRVTAIDVARKFIEDTTAQWTACSSAAGATNFDADKFRQALGQLFAQLELNVIALYEIDFPDRIERMIEKTIISYLNEMIAASYDPYLIEIFSNKITCPCLRDFCLQRYRLFDEGPRLMKAMYREPFRYR